MEVERSTSDEASAFNAKLSNAIKHTLRISLLLSGCFFAVQPGLADTNDLPTVDVPPPPDWDPPDWNPPPIDPGNGGGGGDGGGGGGGGGVGGDPSPAVPCPTLILQKPAECPNPIPLPGGLDYGRDQFANGSGLAKVLYYREQESTAPKARGQVTVALNAQTSMMAEGIYSNNAINDIFFTYMSYACKYQTEASDGYRIGLTLTVPERLCLEAMGKAQAEAEQTMSFVPFFMNWLNKEGVDLSDLFPQTLVNLLSPENSMTVKYNLVTKDATCSRWWQQMEQNQCSI